MQAPTPIKQESLQHGFKKKISIIYKQVQVNKMENMDCHFSFTKKLLKRF